MTDLLQNMQEVYKKWESRSVPNRGRLKRNSYENRCSGRRQNYGNDIRPAKSYRRTPLHDASKYDCLAEFKMAPSVVSPHKPRPFGVPCVKCVPRSRAGIDDDTLYLLGIHNILHIPYSPFRQSFTVCFWNLFRAKPAFLSHSTSVDLLKTERVEEAIKKTVNARKEDDTLENFTIEILHEKSKKILKDLQSSISYLSLEITSFCLRSILSKVFNGIFVHKGQIEILKILSDDGIPFIYLPIHRSYFDYILVPYILHMNSLKTPFTTITDELYVPILSYFCKILGGIFVKNNVLFSENYQEDILYDAIVQSYIIRCLENGHNVELFLEGHRSTTGKPQIPNTKLLSAVVHSVSEGSIEDVYVVPVSVSYETADGNLVAEQLKSHHKEETSFLSKLHAIWKILHLRYGNVRVNFNQPFSLKEFLQTYSAKQKKINCGFISDSQSSDSGCGDPRHETKNEMDSVVNNLASHAMYDAITCTPLMSTHLLAFLLVTQFRKGGTQQQLQSSMDWLRGEILHKKCDVGFTGESLPVIKRAIEMLGKDLILSETVEMEWTSSDLENNNVKIKIFTPVVKLPHILELQYYANAVVPLFVKESIVVNALYALVDVDICHFHHCDNRFFVSREGLVQRAVKLSELLKYEFVIIPPCQDITSAFNDAVDELIEKECLSVAGISNSFLKAKRKHHALSFDASDDEQYADDDDEEQQLKINLKEESICHLEFLRSILSPYIESYWLAACSLLRLIDEVKEESVFIREMQMTAQEKLYKGLLAYEESFSAETMKNSLKMFCDCDIVEYDCIDNIRTICLSEEYNSFESVNDIIADIEDFRK